MTGQIPVVPATSAAILDALIAEAGNDRRRETLSRLKLACDSLESTGTSFQLANVQRVVEKQFGKQSGPKAQSISNERKRSLGMYHYVEAREREALASRRPERLRGLGGTDAATRAIDQIDDIDVRSSMQDLHDRLLVAEKGLARAKTLFKSLGRGADWELLIAGQESQERAGGDQVPEALVLALQRMMQTLTDNVRLDAVGLHYDGRRIRRKTGTRDELIDPTTLSSVQELTRKLLRR